MCVWVGVFSYSSMLFLYQGPPGAAGEQGFPVSRSVSVLYKTHAHITQRLTIFFHSQGAPGPKGEPGVGLSEVRGISVFSTWVPLTNCPWYTWHCCSGRGRATAQGGPEDPGWEGPDPGAHDWHSRWAEKQRWRKMFFSNRRIILSGEFKAKVSSQLSLAQTLENT